MIATDSLNDKSLTIFISDDTHETDEKLDISNATIDQEPIDVEVDEVAPSSTSLERSILLDQNSVVECETVEEGEDDEDDVDNLYNLLNIEKRTDKSSDPSKVDRIESISAGEKHATVIQPEAELSEVPSQSNSHACNRCGKFFNRSGNLKRHQESVHGTVTQIAKNPKGNSELRNRIDVQVKCLLCVP